MRAILPVTTAAMIALLGCSDDSNSSGQSTNAASSDNPITAPVDYLGAVGNAKQRAVKTIDIASLTQAIRMFQVSEGRNPKDLQELVSQQYLREIPKAPYGQKIMYDPTNGTVRVVAESP
jgi:hypothetical protein